MRSARALGITPSDMQMRWRLFFGSIDVVSAGLTAVVVRFGLHVRVWPVDLVSFLVVGSFLASGIALMADTKYADTIARIACSFVLLVGLTLVLALVATAAWLEGVFGPVGKAGAAVYGISAALVLPYVVLIPAAELLWLGPPRPR